MLGATAGRTTLNGEGLQHEDGHSHLLASAIPALRAYDPAFAYELAAIVRDGIERMYGRRRGRLLLRHALQRELRPCPPKPEGVDEGIVRGHLPLPRGARDRGRREAPGPPRRLGRDPPAGAGGARAARRALRRGRRGVQRDLVAAAPPRRPRGRALEPPPPDRRRRGCRTSARCSAPDGGPVVARLGLGQGAARPARALAPAGLRLARHGGLRAQRHARGAAGALRDRRRRTSPWPPWPRSSAPARSRPRGVAEAIAALGIDPEQARPARPVAPGTEEGPRGGRTHACSPRSRRGAGRPAARAHVVRRTHRPSRLLPSRVRDPPPLARRGAVRRPGCPRAVPSRAVLEPGRDRRGHRTSRPARRGRRVDRVHAALGPAHGRSGLGVAGGAVPAGRGSTASRSPRWRSSRYAVWSMARALAPDLPRQLVASRRPWPRCSSPLPSPSWR